MKINQLYMVCGVLLLGAATLAGCSNEERYDVDGDSANRVFFNPAAAEVSTFTIYHTPVGEFGAVEAGYPIRLQYASEDSVLATAVVDTSLVATYNEAHQTQYEVLPREVLAQVKIKNAGIKAGTQAGSDCIKVTLPNEYCAKLTAEAYLIPVRIAVGERFGGKAEREVKASSNLGVRYIVVKTTRDLAKFTGSTEAHSAIVRTPVGVFGGIEASFSAALNHPIDSELKVSAEPDNSLIDAYNEAHKTSYKALPDNVVKALKIEAGVIAAGKTATDSKLKLSVPTDLATSLTEPGYILPVKMVAQYANGTKETLNSQVAYLIVETKESLINDKPNGILGTIQENGGDEWTCVSAEHFDPAKMSDGPNGGWDIDGKRLSSASFIIDLNKIHKLSSFMIDGSLVNNAHVYLSTDQSTWTDLGETNGHGSAHDSEWNSWYVLYGGVAARYVKVELALNANSWAWNYAQWGYCKVKFNFAFDD